MEKQIESFILNAVSCDSRRDIEFIDELLESFEVDVYNAVNQYTLLNALLDGSDSRPLNTVIRMIFEHIIKVAVTDHEDDYDIDASKFSYYVHSADSHLYFVDEEVFSREDITAAIEPFKRGPEE